MPAYSAATSLNVRSHRLPANVSTLVLCTSVTCWRARAARQLERVADAALDTHPGVDRALRRHLVRRALAQHAALADVRPLGVLADDDEVVRLRVTGRGAGERSLVDVEIELEPHLEQQPALDHARRHVGRADRAEQDRVELAQLVERGVAEDLAVAEVPGAAEVEVGGFELDARGVHDLERFGGHLRPDPVAADHCNLMCHTKRPS